MCIIFLGLLISRLQKDSASEELYIYFSFSRFRSLFPVNIEDVYTHNIMRCGYLESLRYMPPDRYLQHCKGRLFITATCLQFARQFPAHMSMLLSKPIWINLAVRFHEMHCQMLYWTLNMPHPQFSLHTFILEWLVREIFRDMHI